MDWVASRFEVLVMKLQHCINTAGHSDAIDFNASVNAEMTCVSVRSHRSVYSVVKIIWI